MKRQVLDQFILRIQVISALPLLAIFFALNVFGCTWTTTGLSTNWTDPLAWTASGSGCSGSYPSTTNISSGDIVIINHNMNLTTTTYQVKSGGTLTINSPANLTVTGGVDLQNGSTFTLNQGATLNVSGNFNNSNNSTGVVVNGNVNVGGNLTSGNGSTVTSSTGSGSFTVQGSISGAGTVFGSSADCANTAIPCVTNAASPLPVELSSMNVDCLKETVIITWETQSEHNSDYFAIERSRNGTAWELIGEVKAAGFSNSNISYSFVDKGQFNSSSYYRISQYDIDGEMDQFPLLKAECKESEANLTVFPNPSRENAYVRFVSDRPYENVMLHIVDIQGNKLGTEVKSLVQGVNVFPLEPTNFASGVLFVELLVPGEVSHFTSWIKE